GSSHIAKESIRRVTKEIEDYSPDIVALELDQKRAYALLQKERSVDYWAVFRSVGLKGFFFTWIGAYAQKKLGNIVGVEPGAEMKKALIVAKQKEINIALIDQDIEITLRKLSKRITWKEKFRFVKEIFKALIFRPKLKFDIRKVPSDKVIKELISEVKEKYPNVYDVLIDERNKIMAKRLFNILRKNPSKKVLAVVGAGHKEEIINLIKKFEKEN
ncbi:TraB family protein, partial [Candidatus Woesearchaeota archaeon]|nr:TraB family protein [Candidatus Woesearchaeota archaeon]